MTEHTSSNRTLRAAVSVSEMAKMLSLSRARLYELIHRGIFLPPVYSTANRRPLYTADMQQRNLEVRRSQRGINDEYVMFYERQRPSQVERSPRSTRRRAGRNGRHNGLIHGLRSLGMDATAAQIERAMATCFPEGPEGINESEVLRAVYRHLRRPQSA